MLQPSAPRLLQHNVGERARFDAIVAYLVRSRSKAGFFHHAYSRRLQVAMLPPSASSRSPGGRAATNCLASSASNGAVLIFVRPRPTPNSKASVPKNIFAWQWVHAFQDVLGSSWCMLNHELSTELKCAQPAVVMLCKRRCFGRVFGAGQLALFFKLLLGLGEARVVIKSIVKKNRRQLGHPQSRRRRDHHNHRHPSGQRPSSYACPHADRRDRVSVRCICRLLHQYFRINTPSIFSN